MTVKREPTLLSSGGGPGPEWENPDGARVEDASRARISLTSSGTSNARSEALTASGFGFALPASAVIRGVTVHVRRRFILDGNEDFRDGELRLAPNAIASGTDHAAHPWPTTFLTGDYGGETDLWGLSLTPQMLNAEAFSVVLRAENHGSSGDAEVDAIAMSVTYCEAP